MDETKKLKWEYYLYENILFLRFLNFPQSLRGSYSADMQSANIKIYISSRSYPEIRSALLKFGKFEFYIALPGTSTSQDKKFIFINFTTPSLANEFLTSFKTMMKTLQEKA